MAAACASCQKLNFDPGNSSDRIIDGVEKLTGSVESKRLLEFEFEFELARSSIGDTASACVLSRLWQHR